MSLLDKASLIVTPNGYKASKLYSVVPSSGAGDLDVTRATTATRVNSLGLIESVANNVPRLDYTDGSCPSLLVEPQRTNLFTYSEQFDNINWTKSNMNVTANSSTSPDGTTTADTITVISTSAELYGAGTSATTTTTSSVFVKKGNQKYFGLTINGVNNFDSRYQAVFDLDNGTIFQENNSSTPLTNRSAKIESYSNGWYKVSVTATFAILAVGFVVFQHSNSVPNIPSDNLAWNNSTNGNTFIWGAQLEAGSYATSYIPTTTASVTRNADVISKTGITSLIGQTEGTLFVEEVYDASIANNGGLDDTLVSLTDGTSSNLISIFHYGLGIGNVLFFIRLSGATQVAISTSTPTSGTYKIALAYKNNDVVGYINGIQIGTDTSATIPATSVITLVDPITTNAATKTVKRKNVAVWKTRLTNAELATLTTI